MMASFYVTPTLCWSTCLNTKIWHLVKWLLSKRVTTWSVHVVRCVWCGVLGSLSCSHCVTASADSDSHWFILSPSHIHRLQCPAYWEIWKKNCKNETILYILLVVEFCRKGKEIRLISCWFWFCSSLEEECIITSVILLMLCHNENFQHTHFPPCGENERQIMCNLDLVQCKIRITLIACYMQEMFFDTRIKTKWQLNTLHWTLNNSTYISIISCVNPNSKHGIRDEQWSHQHQIMLSVRPELIPNFWVLLEKPSHKWFCVLCPQVIRTFTNLLVNATGRSGCLETGAAMWWHYQQTR